MAGYALRYARALFQVGLDEGSGQQTRYGELLSGFIKGLVESPGLRRFLSGPHINKMTKKRFLAGLFADREDSRFLSFLKVLIDKDRIDIIDRIGLDYRRLCLDSERTLEAVIETAFPLDADIVENIKAAFRKKTGALGIVATVKIVPQLIGGIRVIIGSTVYDGSTRSELDRLNEKMKNRG